MRFVETFKTLAPPSVALSYITDFSNLTSWDPSVTRAVKTSGGKVKQGSTFTVDLVFAERPLSMYLQLQLCSSFSIPTRIGTR